MSGRLYCYKQQQHYKLLVQLVFKESAVRFNTRMKTRAPLPDCHINNALIQFVPRCQDTQTQLVDVLDLHFSENTCSTMSCLVVGIFMPRTDIVSTFCHLEPGGAVIMPHCVDHSLLHVQPDTFYPCPYSLWTKCHFIIGTTVLLPLLLLLKLLILLSAFA